jgi:hypothetical protein
MGACFEYKPEKRPNFEGICGMLSVEENVVTPKFSGTSNYPTITGYLNTKQ